MNLTLRQVQYVCAVADRGSIQAASRSLHISPSSILAAVDLAESSLGQRLFDRKRSAGLLLTPGGERFVAAGRRLLAAEVEFQRQIGLLQAEPRALRIGCFEPFGPLFMMEALKTFAEDNGPVDVALFEGDQTQLADWLSRGLVDLVVAYDIGPGFNASVTPVCRVPAHVLLSVDHPLANRDRVAITDLAAHPLVLLDLPVTAVYLLTLFELCGVKPRVNFRARTYETVRSAVAAGFGAAVLNMRPLAEAQADDPRLVRLPLADDLPAPVLQVVDLYGALKPRPVRRLIDIVVGLFRDVYADRFAVVTPERAATLFQV